MCALIPATAQNYSTDAILKNSTGKVATLEASGIARNKKEAIEMAKKSVIYTYLYNGIDGLNNGKPLLGFKPSEAGVQYANQMLGSTRYASFIRSCTEMDKRQKTVGKNVQVFVVIDLYAESLYRDMVNNGIIGRDASTITLSETQGEIAMPTIMVVPFRKGSESYEEAIRNNSDMRMAISKVNEGFINEGVETKDLLTSLNNANTYQVRMGDGMSLDDMILINSGADVAVNVDINQDVNDGGVRVSLTLQAVEIATGNTLATKSEISGRKRTTADVLCSVMAKAMVGDFMKQISTRMATKITTGQSVAVRFTIDPGSAINMDTEINNIMPLSDILISWVKRHAKNGKYHTQGRTSTLLAFSDIFIDNSMEDGMQSDINDFSLALYQYLKGLNLSVSRTITGNSIDVIIY
ncbi:DUF6175 family protein [uncultured Alistipes sp.]|uniref:DUF6175 family protein n=1 Tax=uncultured Alistipes sp. TaxID=538949 RepID=UPI0027D95C0B|nr:DUF6175 family protein [uncultured Alistipes sp.]